MSELKPRPHAEIIKAWADGKTIQGRRKTSIVWDDVTSAHPAFFSDWEYRIKPEPAKFQSRRCLIKSGNAYILSFVTTDRSAKAFEKSHWFVKWIDTEWQYVEVEVEQ